MSTTTVQQLIKMPAEVDENNPKKFVFPCDIGTDYTFKRDIVWKNVFGFIVLHLGAFYGLYLAFTEVKWLTVPYVWILIFITGEGVTAGAHRLYSHKSYKAALPFRIILLILQTMAGQNCMYIWVRDHRQHHKYSDTDADPHNSNRGFFFCHMGWLMSKKHPLVKEKGKTIDMSDLEADPWVMFQKKHYKTLYFIFALIIPVYFPVLFWNETLWNSFFTSYFLRYVTLLHITWTVNSIAHFYGTKPFDKNIVAVESKVVSLWAGGEGWHNYHHAFPWDYKASEFVTPLNATTCLIDTMAYLGMAYDLREASCSMIERRVRRAGDGSHKTYGTSMNNNTDFVNIPDSNKKGI
ncbi:hypothetical protein HHI36_016286 [Cryptolaemus montrouzieri]|uniref:Fatty acid desaturase domain-containing protein n=1 Tax=Cryptolaemus montrouzieri TaxID=559131 RepID=A0ABD2NJR4_9CUCU